MTDSEEELEFVPLLPDLLREQLGLLKQALEAGDLFALRRVLNEAAAIAVSGGNSSPDPERKRAASLQLQSLAAIVAAAGAWDDAETLVREALRQLAEVEDLGAAELCEALLLLVRVQVEKKQPDAALDALGRVFAAAKVALAPDHGLVAQAFIFSARAWLLKGDHIKAHELLHVARRRFSQDPGIGVQTLWWLAQSYQSDGQNAQASEFLKELIALAAPYPELQMAAAQGKRRLRKITGNT